MAPIGRRRAAERAGAGLAASLAALLAATGAAGVASAAAAPYEVTARLSAAEVLVGSTVAVRGRVLPAAPGRTVLLQARRDGAWRTVDSAALSEGSTYRFGLVRDAAGARALRVVKPAGARPAGHSPRLVSAAALILRASVPSGTGGQAGKASGHVSVSGDGRWVAFASSAAKLAPGDTNGRSDVFVRDLATGTTRRVSTSSSGAQARGSSTEPSLSRDGRKIAFTSTAANLVPGEQGREKDVYVKDLVTGKVIRASERGEGSVNGGSRNPALSADGTHVAFTSDASNLVRPDHNDAADVFVRDLRTGKVALVSTGIGGEQLDGASWAPSISADGNRVAFTSRATNLVAGDGNGHQDVFVRFRSTGATAIVSTSDVGDESDRDSWQPALSADGTTVAFTSAATNLIRADGNGEPDVFAKILLTGEIRRVNEVVSDEQAPGGGASSPAISADGSRVAFVTAADLLPGDGNGSADVFVRDLQALTLVRITGRPGVTTAAAAPAMSAAGRRVAFASPAARLVPGDTNGVADVFASRSP